MTAAADAIWKSAGLPAPARRALIGAGILTVAELARCREQDVLALHGMGPNSVPKLRAALVDAGLRFASAEATTDSGASSDDRLLVGAAAIVRRGDTSWELLTARRTEPPSAAGLWEFPGGKVEADETPEQCVRREIREELGVELVLHEQILGPDEGWWQLLPNIVFAFWLCTIIDGQQPQLLEDHDAMAWLGVDELDSVPWIPADLPVVRTIGAMLEQANQTDTFPSLTSLPKQADVGPEGRTVRQ